jgi:hypothetical protein
MQFCHIPKTVRDRREDRAKKRGGGDSNPVFLRRFV